MEAHKVAVAIAASAISLSLYGLWVVAWRREIVKFFQRRAYKAGYVDGKVAAIMEHVTVIPGAPLLIRDLKSLPFNESLVDVALINHNLPNTAPHVARVDCPTCQGKVTVVTTNVYGICSYCCGVFRLQEGPKI